MTLVSSTVVALAVAFVVIAALAALLSVGVFAHVVVTNRRARLMRQESIGTYYRDLALGH